MQSLIALFNRILSRLNGLFGRGLLVSLAFIALLAGLLLFFAVSFFNAAAPKTVTISSGPEGSSFQRNAEKYQKILAKEGVQLEIRPSEGSLDNLRRLNDPTQKVDIGFVLSGEARDQKYEDILSLGSVAYQPLLLFYRGKERHLLSDFKGARLNIGPEGSGTHALALALLKLNGIAPGAETVLEETDLIDPTDDLLKGRLDAVFLMSDSTASAVTRQLMNNPEVRLFSFVQADAYVRRVNTLSKLQLPRGALNFGKDIPSADVHLIGPTVQLLARDTLHPALSDLLLEAAREVHGTAGLYRKRGEFPIAQEGEFRISPDATRYYASGKSFLYRNFPFWLASLIARILAVVVPLLLLLVPALKIAPMIYRWRIESRIYRWYRALLELEREAFRPSVSTERRAELLGELDAIEVSVNRIVVPASFGDLFYGLRGHIGLVRNNLLQGTISGASRTF